MTTLPNRPNAALLVVDVQNGVVTGSHNLDDMLANINALVTKARNEEVPVVWVQHNADNLPSGSDQWKIVSALTPLASEPVVQKRYGDSFEDTELEHLLSERGVGKLVVTGAQTD